MKEETTRIKQEFAKAFDWYETRNHYSQERKPLTPSWEQIFVEIGRIKAKNNEAELREWMHNIDCRMRVFEDNE